MMLERSIALLYCSNPESIEYEIFRNAVFKGVELTLEAGTTLLRRALKTYSGSPRNVDNLTIKDYLRHSATPRMA